MGWFRASPFRSSEEAAQHMVDLLAAEGEVASTPLTDDEREVLVRSGTISPELSDKARMLITRIFDQEIEDDSDPRSFSNSLKWATDPGWPNIAELTVQVATERNPDLRLHGWHRFKDKIQLVACGLLAVMLMMVLAALIGVVFHWK
jgi:hypothetical protein